MIKQISHISLSTKNINKVIDFYIKVLGFKISHRFINPKNNTLYGLFIYCGNKTFLEFFNYKKKLSKGTKFRHICFQVSNIKNVAKKLKKFDKKIKIKRGKTDKVLQFMTKDFDKNLIEFHQYDKKSKLKY
tara:strand:+ start:6064 stop:6456 length:393 start_codon:yes stop_codon:yes gene_type:complete